jgi:heterodisulfide reductase subunit B
MNHYALFLGCTIPVRAQNYELATRKVAAALDIPLLDIDNFTCCGFPIDSVCHETSFLMAARNLALAERHQANLCTICTACTGVLTEASRVLRDSETKRDEINRYLRKMDLEYHGTVDVKHFVRLLIEAIGLNVLQEKITRPLTGLRFAPHYGCHYLKPTAVYDGFDSDENPQTLDRLISLTGAESIRYEEKLACCGGALLAVDEGLALKISKKKLDNLKANQVDAIVLICPFCSIMYESNQRKIETTFQTEYHLPVLYYPQILGLALGMAPNELGFNQNRVRPTAVLEKLAV